MAPVVRPPLDRSLIVINALFANLPIRLDECDYFLRRDEDDDRLVVCAQFLIEMDDEDFDEDEEDACNMIEVDLDFGDFLRCVQGMDEDYLTELEAQTAVRLALGKARKRTSISNIVEEETEE